MTEQSPFSDLELLVNTSSLFGDGIDSRGTDIGLMQHDKIREFRERKGWSQERLGQAVGLLASAISKLENGQKQLRVTEVQKIAAALEVPVTEFFDPAVAPAEHPAQRGFSDDLVPYQANPGDPFLGLQSEHRYLMTVTCDSLTRLGIARGMVVVVDGSAAECGALRPEVVVRAQYHPASETAFGKAVTLLRQYVSPGLLVTRSDMTFDPAVLDLNHDDVQILGVIKSVHRALNA
jgi:transcriptional regulator with XRE-family HTH domain